MIHISYGKQYIDEDDINAVVNVLQSDYLTTGPVVTEFEKIVADYVGAKYAVAVSSGTAALHTACFAAGIQPGDEIITTPITFAASANCALYFGATPVFADIKRDTYNIDPKEIQKKITKHTKAIIPVHYTGQPCEMEEIQSIAKRYGLILIEDAAHALGAEYHGKKIGSISDMTIFSFHPVKHITTGEGGMITTNNETLYERLKLFRSHGIIRGEKCKVGNEKEGDWYYQQIDLGYNYRITDIQSALGISQMKKLDMFIERRKYLAERYNKAFSDRKEIICPFQQIKCNSSWHLYVIQVDAEKRLDLYDTLQKAGIHVNVHYIPVYQHPYYQNHGYNKIHCANAELFYKRIISLPLYYSLTDDEQDYVIHTIKESFS